MKEYRPPGPTCLKAIEIIDQFGKMGVRDILKHFPTSTHNAMSDCLRRATQSGYLIRHDGDHSKYNPNTYTAAVGWREMHARRLELYKKQPRKDKPQIKKEYLGVNSVFALGANL